MGRVIGLIACSSLAAASLWLVNLDHGSKTISAGVDAPEVRESLSAQDYLKRGKEFVLRGRYAEAITLLESAGNASGHLSAADKQQIEFNLRYAREKQRQLSERLVTARGQSPVATDPFSMAEPAATSPYSPVSPTTALAAPASSDDVRTRVQTIMQQARSTYRQGNAVDALRQAGHANQLAQQNRITFAAGEESPALFIARVQAARPEAAAQANLAGPIQQAGYTEAPASITLTGGETTPFAPPTGTPAAPYREPQLPAREQAVQMLAQAQQDIQAGHYEEARAKALKAQAMGVTWDLFDVQPGHVLAEIERRTQTITYAAPGAASPAAGPAAPDAEATKQRAARLLSEANAAFEAEDYATARTKAVQARDLNVTYTLFEDRPELLLADLDAVATQNGIASTGSPAESSPSGDAAADQRRAHSLLLEARRLLTDGRVDDARKKAHEADALDVVYGLFDDTPQLILEDVRRVEQQKKGGVQTADASAGASDPFAMDSQIVPVANQSAVAAPVEVIESELAVIYPENATAIDLYNMGLMALRSGQRNEAYRAFLACYNKGETLDAHRARQLQDYLRELAPRRDSNIELVKNESLSVPNSIGLVEQKQNAQFDRLRSDVLQAIFKAERLREQDPVRAVEVLDQALAMIEGSDLSPEMLAPLSRSLQKSRESLDSYKSQREPLIALEARNKEIKAVIEQEHKTAIRVDQEFAQLVEEFNKLMKMGSYAEAEVVAKQAQELNPDKPEAEVMFWKSRFARRRSRDDQIRLDKEDSWVRTMQDVDAGLINPVIEDSIAFPKNWKELSDRRRKFGQLDNKVRTEAEQRIEQSLEKRISLHFHEQPLSEVMKHIRTIADVNIVLDTLGLADAAVDTNSPVTIDVDGIMLRSALNLMLEPHDLAYTVQDEVLKITSRMRQQGDLKIITYPVADLVIPVPNFVSPHLGVGGTLQPGVGYGGAQLSVPSLGGMQNSQGFAQPAVSTDGFGGPLGTAGSGMAGGGRSVDFDTLSDLIIQTVEPDSWQEVGGPATVRPYETTLSLVIRQTQQVHDEIADLLEQLRRLQDLQVTVEVRFVTVSDAFFERIGVDFDFNVQDGVGGPNIDNNGAPLPPFGAVIAGQLSQAGTAGQAAQTGQAAQAGQTPAGEFGFTPTPTRNLVNRDRYPSGTIVGRDLDGTFTENLDIPFRQGSFELGQPEFGGFTQTAGMTVGLAILSDIEAFFFIQAAQGDQRSNLMFAPKVTLFNGQSATVTSQTARPFVTSLIPTVGFFSVGFQPVITTIPEGVSLTVSAVISADRRFVRLTVIPFFSTITGVETFSFVSGGAGGGGNVGLTGGQGAGQQQAGAGAGGGLVGVGGIGGQAQAGQAQQGQQGQQQGGAAGTNVTVQQPIVDFVSVTTTVSVPDGGTVLLGGIKRLREGRSMNGVPILNKIPYVSRLFRNKGVGRETESLMMMVTPRIIIQEEEEELLGL